MTGCTSTNTGKNESHNNRHINRVVSRESAIDQARQVVRIMWPDWPTGEPQSVTETENAFVVLYPPLPWTELGTNLETEIVVHKDKAKIDVHPITLRQQGGSPYSSPAAGSESGDL